MKYFNTLNNYITESLWDDNMEINNEIKHHLSQYPFLDYSIRDSESNDGVVITFGRATSVKYIKGLLDPYIIKLLKKTPVKIKVSGKKKMDDESRLKNKAIIGNLVNIDIPGLDIKKLPSKSDTGATTSSLHVEFLKTDLKKGMVTFKPLDNRYEQYNGKEYTYPIESQIRVQSSNGDEESRPLIKLDIIIDGEKMQTFFTLADRKELEFPVLLGKDLLSNFLIDAGINET